MVQELINKKNKPGKEMNSSFGNHSGRDSRRDEYYQFKR